MDDLGGKEQIQMNFQISADPTDLKVLTTLEVIWSIERGMYGMNTVGDEWQLVCVNYFVIKVIREPDVQHIKKKNNNNSLVKQDTSWFFWDNKR